MKKYLGLFLGLALLITSINSYAAWDATSPASNEKAATSQPKIVANWESIADGSVPQQGTSYVDFDVDSDLTNGPAATISKTGIVFEGTTADAHETTISATDPTADRTITIPDSDVTLHSAGSDTSLGTLTGASPIVLEGATANDHETTIAVTDPTADRTITLPNETGTVLTTGSSGVLLPSGAVFFMITGSCPTGTTDVTATYSDRFLKVHATQGTTAGPTLTGTTDSHTLTTAEMPAHTHTYEKTVNSGGDQAGKCGADAGCNLTSNTSSTGSGGGHTHTFSAATTLEPKSVTCKLCQVD